ncbi:MAG: amino acid permease [Pseudomonadota bacterium]
MNAIKIIRLICINVLVIDSLRNLPIIANLGSNLFMLYIVAAVIFLIPVAYLSRRIAEVGLSTGAASIYQFTRMELGHRMAKLQEVFLWVYNVLWYPTLILFLGSFIAPIIKEPINANYLSLFFLIPMLLLSLLPILFSSSVSTVFALIGAIIPMSILSIYAFVTIFMHPSHSSLSYFMPHLGDLKLSYIPTVFFSLMGIEIATMHSDLLFSKKSQWNIALWISVVLIIFLLTGCGLAVWEMGQGHFLGALTISLMKVFSFVPVPHFSHLIILLIALSILAQAVFWMQATARGIVKAFSGGVDWLKVRLTVVLQTVITLIAMIGIIKYKSFNSAFIYVSNLSVLFAVFYYMILMSSYLKYCHTNKKRKTWGIIGAGGIVVLLITVLMTL